MLDEQCISWWTHDGGVIFFSDHGTRSGCQLVSFCRLNIGQLQFGSRLNNWVVLWEKKGLKNSTSVLGFWGPNIWGGGGGAVQSGHLRWAKDGPTCYYGD
jgi:hypothetical protein